MRRLPSAAPPGDRPEAGLPTVVEELLIDVARDGFTLYCCGPKAAPNALVATYEWDHYLDLLTIRGFDRIIGARVPKQGVMDIFAPQVVVWAYEGPPQQVLRAVLDLAHPGHPRAPAVTYPAPAMLHVPHAQQRPMTIRLPPPEAVTARAIRLATVLTTPDAPIVAPGQPAVPDAAPGGQPVCQGTPDQ